MMEHYEPIMSLGEDDAEIYDTEPDVSQRGDTLAVLPFEMVDNSPSLCTSPMGRCFRQ